MISVSMANLGFKDLDDEYVAFGSHDFSKSAASNCCCHQVTIVHVKIAIIRVIGEFDISLVLLILESW